MKDIKEIILNVINEAKNMTVENTIKYLESIFPKDKYKWEQVRKNSDLYVDHRDIIHITDNNFTQLIIRYPGGDRFGSSFSDPNYDVYFSNPFKEPDNNSNSDLYLFRESKYNEDNHIKEHLEDILKEHQITAEDVVFVLKDSWDSLPIKILNHLENEILEDKLVIHNIVECVKRISARETSEAYDQYMYGHNGGEDVADWQLSQASQFKMLWEYLPSHVKTVCHTELKNAWLALPDTEKELNKAQTQTVKEINKIIELSQNREKYINDIHNRFFLLKKYESFSNVLESVIPEDGVKPLNIVNDLHCELCEISLNDESIIHNLNDIESTINSLKSENILLEQEVHNLSNAHFYFWQGRKKQITINQMSEKKEILKENIETIKTLNAEKEKLQQTIDIVVSFKQDVSEMSKISSSDLYWKHDLLSTEEAVINNYSEDYYVDMVNKKMDSRISELSELNKEFSELTELLEEAALTKTGKVYL